MGNSIRNYLFGVICILGFIVLFGCGGSNNPAPSVSIPFNSLVWKQGNHSKRGQMIDNLLSLKDSLLINKTRAQVELVLGLPEDSSTADLSYYFKNKSNNPLAVVCIFKVGFDTIEDKSINAWWTD